MLESLGGKDVTMPSKARRDRTAVALTTGTGSSSMVIVYCKSKQNKKESTGTECKNCKGSRGKIMAPKLQVGHHRFSDTIREN